MTLLNFKSRDPKRTGEKKTLSIILGIGALVGVIALGSTLAASINLNSNNPVEFGQGVAQATACDDSVVVTPQSTFFNGEEDAGFIFSSFSVTDVSSACNGKVFTIKAYKNGQNGPLDLYTTEGVAEPFSEVQVLDTAGSFTLIGAGLLSDDIQDISTGFNVNLSTGHAPVSTAIASAQDVDRITVESNDSVDGTPAGYEVGDVGPGGGKIFYYSEAGFNCGENFSSTGSPTGRKCNYLEAAPTTGTNAWTDAFYAWSGNTEDLLGTTSSAIGSGYLNTIQMSEQTNGGDIPDRAGTISLAYIGPNNTNDWYLPSIDELNELYLQRATVGGFEEGGGYLSSTEQDAGTAIFRDFGNGNTYSYSKFYTLTVRPIRAF